MADEKLLDDVLRRAENPGPALEGPVADALRGAIREQFATAGARLGTPWAPRSVADIIGGRSVADIVGGPLVRTGDLVRSVVTSGTKQGTYVGKVAVRSRGTFNISTAHGVVTDIPHRFCVLVARSDGYSYQQGKEAAFPPSA